MTDKDYSHFRCGYVAIIGRPNVGKSTLMNNILHFKLSIVTPKPQTTRHKILGIYNDDDSQILFLDTPGIIDPKYKLQQYLVKAAETAAADADVVVFMIEASEQANPADVELLQEISASGKPILICINKIDLIKKSLLLPLIDRYSKESGVREIIPISALKNDGIDDLVQSIKSYLPTGPPLYPTDQLTTINERFLVSEIIREKIFLLYGEEIPYSTTVQIEEFREQPGKKDYIRAAIVVERDSQKGILIGKKGEALKRVGKLAREEIEFVLGRPVFLELVVVVRPKWRERDDLLKSLGYSRNP